MEFWATRVGSIPGSLGPDPIDGQARRVRRLAVFPGRRVAHTTNRLYDYCVIRSPEDRADALFHALADRTRRDILRQVFAGERSVTALAGSYDMSFAAVQKHVAVLERAGLLRKRRQGREALASGEVDAVRSAGALLLELEGIWRGRIGRIEALLDETAGDDGPRRRTTLTKTPKD